MKAGRQMSVKLLDEDVAKVKGIAVAEGSSESAVVRRIVHRWLLDRENRAGGAEEAVPDSKPAESALPGESFKADPDEIAALFNAFPMRHSFGAACAAIGKALSIERFGVLLAAVQAYGKAVGSWPKGERKFICSAATWFDNMRWKDDPECWESRAPMDMAKEKYLPDGIPNFDYKGPDGRIWSCRTGGDLSSAELVLPAALD